MEPILFIICYLTQEFTSIYYAVPIRIPRCHHNERINFLFFLFAAWHLHRLQRGQVHTNTCCYCLCGGSKLQTERALYGLSRDLSQLKWRRRTMRDSSNEPHVPENSASAGPSHFNSLPVSVDAAADVERRVRTEEREHLRARLDVLEHKLDLVLATLAAGLSNTQVQTGAQLQWPRVLPPDPNVQMPRYQLVSRFWLFVMLHYFCLLKFVLWQIEENPSWKYEKIKLFKCRRVAYPPGLFHLFVVAVDLTLCSSSTHRPHCLHWLVNCLTAASRVISQSFDYND